MTSSETSWNQLDRERQEEFARHLVTLGERPKVDLKRADLLKGRLGKAQLTRLICAFVNTDAEEFDNYGFVVLGARRGEVLGGADAFAGDGDDTFEASLQEFMEGYVTPVPDFNVYGFQDAERGWWGVIAVRPSELAPHVFDKEYSYQEEGGGKTKHLWREGDWVVRRGNKTAAPLYADYERVLGKCLDRHVGPLRAEVEALRGEVHRLQGQLRTLTEARVPQLGVTFVDEQGHPVSGPLILPRPRVAEVRQKIIGRYRESLRKLAAALQGANDSIEEPPQRGGGLISSEMTKRYQVEPARITRVRQHLEEAGILLRADVWAFPGLWVNIFARVTRIPAGPYGLLPREEPDQGWGLPKYRAFTRLEALVNDLGRELDEAAHCERVQPWRVAVQNVGTEAAREITVRVDAPEGLPLGPFGTSRRAEDLEQQLVARWTAELPLVPPEDPRPLPECVVMPREAGEFEFQLRVTGANLPEAQLFTLLVIVLD